MCDEQFSWKITGNSEMPWRTFDYMVNEVYYSDIISIVIFIPLTATQASEQCTKIHQIHLSDHVHKLGHFLILLQEFIVYCAL
jgi:hypothetical protein